MKFVVDADVLSEPTKLMPRPGVVDWLRDHEAELAVSTIVLGELQYGILLMPAGRRRQRLSKWFASGIQPLRVLDFDADCAVAWASLLARLRRKGLAMSVKDSLIAATALAHRLTVATHNVVDFRHAGIPIVDPFRH